MFFSLIALWILTIMLAFAVLAIGGAYLKIHKALFELRNEWRGRFEKVVGNSLPTFHAKTIDGKRSFTDHEIRGHPTLFVFLSPTCNHCHHVMEQLVVAYPQWHALGGRVFGVSNGDSEQMLKFATNLGANFPILAQKQWELAQLFQVNATPWGIAVSSSGIITTSGIMGTDEQLSALMDATNSSTPIY